MKRSPKESPYIPALRKARHDLGLLDPDAAAWRSETIYRGISKEAGDFTVKFWGKDYIINYPQGTVTDEGTGKEPPVITQIILLHYLIHADGVPPAYKWISFRELPGGLGYYPVFRARTSCRLERAFGRDPEGFIRAAEALGGVRLSYGDASFLFRPLPRLYLAVVLHLEDEEFPAFANILFDASAEHYLPTEDLIGLCEMLSRNLVRLAQQSDEKGEGEWAC
jgi:hypothetical protein